MLPDPSAAPPRPTAGLGGAVRPLLPLYALDVLTTFTVGMLPPLLPLLAAEWALSSVEAGLVNTVYALGRLGTTYAASRLRAQRGTRAAVFAGLALLVAGVLGCGLAPGFPSFLAFRAVMGVGAGATFLAIFAELLERAPAAWRGRLTNAFEAMAILSLGVGGSLGAWLAEWAGWRWTFLGAAPVLVACAAFWRPLGPGAGRDPEAAKPAGRRAGHPGHGALVPVYVASLALAMTWAGLFATMAPLLGHEGYGLGAGALGLGLGAGYVAELIGLFGVGVVIDRVRREPLFLAGAVTVAAGGLVLAVGAHAAAFVVGLVLVGGGFAVWMVPATVLADRVGTPVPPGHLAAYRTAMDAGMIAGPLVLGVVSHALGARAAVGGAGVVLLVGAAALGRGRVLYSAR
jgi:MFS family permease